MDAEHAGAHDPVPRDRGADDRARAALVPRRDPRRRPRVGHPGAVRQPRRERRAAAPPRRRGAGARRARAARRPARTRRPRPARADRARARAGIARRLAGGGGGGAARAPGRAPRRLLVRAGEAGDERDEADEAYEAERRRPAVGRPDRPPAARPPRGRGRLRHRGEPRVQRRRLAGAPAPATGDEAGAGRGPHARLTRPDVETRRGRIGRRSMSDAGRDADHASHDPLLLLRRSDPPAHPGPGIAACRPGGRHGPPLPHRPTPARGPRGRPRRALRPRHAQLRLISLLLRPPRPRGAAGGAPLFTNLLGRWEYPGETMENTPAQRGSSAVGTLGKRVVAWLVVAAVAVIALKLIIGAVMGFVTFLLTIVAVVACIAAVVWALRRL